MDEVQKRRDALKNFAPGEEVMYSGVTPATFVGKDQERGLAKIRIGKQRKEVNPLMLSKPVKS